MKFAIVYDRYCLTKSFDSDEINASELDENGCNLPGNNSTLKSYVYNDAEAGVINREEVYYASEYRNNIISISFLYQESVPTNALISWDVSNSQKKSIIAYLMPNGTKYDLYIISKNNIYAPASAASLIYDFASLERINLNNFYTAETTSMHRMFARNKNLKSLDLSGFDTSKVTTFLGTLGSCTSLEMVNLSSFETSNANSMDWMFNSCPNLKSIDVSNFDTSKVTNMTGMFKGCKNLTSLDLSTFDTSNVANMSYMFENAANLTTIYKGSNWVTAATATNMFAGCGTDTLTTKS